MPNTCSSRLPAMDPATHRLAIFRPQPEHLWDRLTAVLQAQDGPPIAMAPASAATTAC
jgi:hypothetical protein